MTKEEFDKKLNEAYCIAMKKHFTPSDTEQLKNKITRNGSTVSDIDIAINLAIINTEFTRELIRSVVEYVLELHD